ncbi:GNAT family N-acetyltransferase [Isoptericola sp. F-RaC21]|uniref:GNAT family N-acetyltransferase n=1 Tax=Isoptericola sp. F-RaC21 TaxID=3141452 RepID=UPI00315C0C9E
MTTPAPRPLPAPQPFVRRAVPADRDALERLWLLFRHDLSAVTGELPRPDGRFRDERLRSALEHLGHDDPSADWRAYLATVPGGRPGGPGGTEGPPDDRPVAFALVRGLGSPTRVLSAFFVVRAVRRSGVGAGVAAAVLRDVPGPWEIAFQDANAAAAAFWPRVAADVAGDRWTLTHRAVPGRPELPPDAWLSLTAA